MSFKGLSCKGYRLPSEAEWERAARAGVRTRYAGTDNPETVCEVGNVADKASGYVHAFECDDGYARLAPVARFRPNDFGLFDMTGNVREWVWDRYGAFAGDARDPLGPERGQGRVIRGGSFGGGPQGARVAVRGRFGPSGRPPNLGFRVARSLP